MSWGAAQALGSIGIGYRCNDSSHSHYRPKKIEELLERGDIERWSKNKRVCYWVEHRTWQGKQSKVPRDLAKPGVGSMSTMQLIAGLPGRKR